MKIINVNGAQYIDQDLFDYINKIWLTYDVEIENDKNIFFGKNTTVNRMITDYCNKNISRVIKKEKADYVVINKFNLSGYPQYFDGVTITKDDSKEVVYGIYNQSAEVRDTIEQIYHFIVLGKEVKYVNQDKLNDSLNNGFIIDKENYTTIKELVDSPYPENNQLAIAMLVNSSLKDNWQWILYLYHGKYNQITGYDKKQVIINYIPTLNLGYSNSQLFNGLDAVLPKISDVDVKDRFISLVSARFNDGIKNYLSETIGTDKFVLDDFKIRYNE